MKTPAWMRPSSLPRLAKCPASGVESEGHVSAASDATALGTAWHEVAAIALAKGREAAAMALYGVATRHGVDGEPLGDWLSRMRWTPPPTARVYLEHPVAIRLAGVELHGTADVVLDDADADCVEVADWKSGDPEYAEPSQWWQLEAYAVAAARMFGRKRARASLCYVRLGDDGWSHLDVDPDEAEPRLAAVVGDALEQVGIAQERRSYRTGSHCTFCPARFTCPARTVELRTFAALAPSHTWELTAENAAQVLERARAIERVTAAAKDAVKEYVRAHGPVPAGEGKELRIVTVQRKEYTVAASVSEQLRAVKL